MKNYGNSFVSKKEEIQLSVEAIWPKVDEFYPVGGYVKVDTTNTVGKLIPAGTPVAVGKIGEVTLNSASPIGLTYQDAYVGENGCTVDIVVKGQFNESLSSATISATQKDKLLGITFITE